MAIVMLGRYGDIIQILPICRRIAEAYGTPHLVVSTKFASVLDGVSYVKPVPVDLPYSEVRQAVDWAKQQFEFVLQAQVWGTDFKLKCESATYDIESWRLLGFERLFSSGTMPVIFDKRDAGREKLLEDVYLPGDNRPLMLTNLYGGHSSPFSGGVDLQRWVEDTYRSTYHIVDLAGVKATRIYDLLALMDRASVLVTMDTATLHLAAAASVPVVSLVAPKGWGASTGRSNIIARVEYNDPALRRKVAQAVDSRAPREPLSMSLVHPVLRRPPTRIIFHSVEIHPQATDARKKFAVDSWEKLYAPGKFVPAYYSRYVRDARKELGDKRDLPFLKDVLGKALEDAADYDIVAFCNDDNTLNSACLNHILFYGSVYEAVAWRRGEYKPGQHPPLTATPEAWRSASVGHIGHDLFVFTAGWLRSNWNSIPDYVLGASEWDLGMALHIRRFHGVRSDETNVNSNKFPAEPPVGVVGHEIHSPQWAAKDNRLSAPSQVHNRALLRAWISSYQPNLRFNHDFTGFDGVKAHPKRVVHT